MDAIFEQIEYYSTWLQVILSGACAVIAMRRAFRGRRLWLYQLLAGAFACDALAAMFWNFYTTIYHQHPWYFSAADLAWLGIYAFLIAVCLGLMGENRSALKKYRLPSALIAAVIVVPTHIYMVHAAGQLFSNICYGIAIFFLLYYTVLAYFGARNENLRPAFLNYHRTIFIYMIVVVITLFFSCFNSGLYYISYVSDWVLILMPPYILYAFHKGVGG